MERFLAHARVQYPIVCGAMYPCSNPELVAAVSEAGGLGVVQPISLAYVHGKDFRAGMKRIRELTNKPVAMNVMTENSSKIYQERMRQWVEIALEEGVRFFVTSLGNPRWIVERVRPEGGIVYHDVTERKWAQKAIDAGVDGLIAVNSRAGGHAGTRDVQALLAELSDYGVPVLCAGGIGTEADFKRALELGYAGVQMGTRFIATPECRTHDDYKDAILKAGAKDIVLTEKISGVPVAVIQTPYIQKVGTKAGPIARKLLQMPKTKHYMRMFYTLQAAWTLKEASLKGETYKDYFQAGQSVEGIESLEPAGDIVRRFGAAAGLPEARVS
jgi:nitronate monooxygenase